ncbi:MAG TPA: hypothetical protein VI359_09160 [Nitrospiraceae bacterium]
MKRLKRADYPVCVIGWENSQDHEIEASVASVEEGLIHFTSPALTHHFIK